MEINIKRDNNNYLLEQSRVKWELFARKNVRIFSVYALVGVFCVAFGVFTHRRVGTFWHFSTCVGLSLILLSSFYFYHLIRNRVKFISRTKDHIAAFEKQKNPAEITLNDSRITYRDIESYWELKWTSFSQYKLYKNYLFLMTDDSFPGAISIRKNELSQKEFAILYKFIATKLLEKE